MLLKDSYTELVKKLKYNIEGVYELGGKKLEQMKQPVGSNNQWGVYGLLMS